MKRVLWWLRRQGLAALAVLGIVLGGAALLIDRTEVAELRRELRTLQREAPRRDVRLAHLDAPATVQGTMAQLEQFHAFFGRAAAPTDQLRRLEQLARARSLVLARAEYRMVEGSRAERGLARYQVVLPLRGRYPVVREFLMAALRELPTMAIEQVQLQRKAIADTDVDAEVTLSFFVVRS